MPEFSTKKEISQPVDFSKTMGGFPRFGDNLIVEKIIPFQDTGVGYLILRTTYHSGSVGPIRSTGTRYPYLVQGTGTAADTLLPQEHTPKKLPSLSTRNDFSKITLSDADQKQPDSMQRPLKFETERETNEWVRLSHLGHVSKDLPSMVDSIENTLKENRFDEIFENDQEVIDEDKRLKHIMSCYPEKAATERALLLVSTKKEPPTKSKMGIITLPVVFDRTSHHPVERCSLGIHCRLCSSKFMDSSTPPITGHRKRFREIEFDPMDFGSSEETTGKSGMRRRGREIVIQRAASLLLLSEIRHTLQFISKYNEGFAQRHTLSLVDSKLGGKSHKPEPSKKAPREFPGISSTGKKAESFQEIAGKSSGCRKVFLETLSHARIVQDFQRVKQDHLRQYSYSNLDVSVSSLQRSILESIEEQPEFEWDEDDTEEHKSYGRAIRSYNGKADQERIERREHEELRELQLRELHYKNRGKKRSAEELELLNLEARPIVFPSSEMDEAYTCQFGPNCMVCASVHEEHNDRHSEAIFLPPFKPMDGDFFDEDVQAGSRCSRTKVRSMQRVVAVEKLKLLHHRLSFVARYNDGWLNTDRRNS